MKYFYFTLFFLFSYPLIAQNSNLNFEEIEKEVQDSTSKYFYERLVYRFQYNPNILDSLEIKKLYYGKFYSKDKSMPLDNSKAEFIESFRKNNVVEAILLGNNLLKTDPTDLEVLALLLRIYSKEKTENENFGLRAAQLKRLLQNIIEHRYNNGNSDVFTVMSIPDEYVVAGFLKIDLSTFKRSSKINKNSIYDTWKNAKQKITFVVMKNHF